MIALPRGPVSGEAGRIGHDPPTPNLRTQRRLSFVSEIARLVAETGLSQRVCFDTYNREFPTFKDYKAFRDFKYDHSDKLRQPDPLNGEITAIFDELQVIEKGPVPSERELSMSERAERRRYVLQLKLWIASDPKALDTILDDYARLTGHG